MGATRGEGPRHSLDRHLRLATIDAPFVASRERCHTLVSTQEPAGAASGPLSKWVAALVLLALLLASTLVRESETQAQAMREAVLWLPSGIGIAAAWWLGWRGVLVAFLGGAAVRFTPEYPSGVLITGSFGAAAEAALGAFLLRRLGVDERFARLRDVIGLFVVAAVAPLASMTACWFGRGVLDVFGDLPFFSGWLGWWRMNALGILTMVPLLGTWRKVELRRPTWRVVATAGSLAIALAAVLVMLLVVATPGPKTVMLTHVTLVLGLFAATRFGPRGAVTVAALAATALAVATSLGIGPFAWIDLTQRHGALQSFELTLLAVPLVLGALIAEREGEIANRIRSEQVLGAVQQMLPDVTYRVRADGTVLSMVVPRGVDGPYRPADIVGKNPWQIDPGPDADRAMASVRATLRGERVEPHERRVTINGVPMARESRYVKLSDDEVLCIVRDVTERRRLEDDLRQAQKMEAVGRLAGGVAHDFNNVLTVIAGSAEAVLAALPKEHPAHDDAVMIFEAAQRAARVTKQMLAFSRQQVLSPEVVELSAVVDGIVGLLRRVIGETVQLSVVHRHGGTMVRVDRGQIEQVILNLVLNARDAMPDGGSVEIATAGVELDAANARSKGGIEPGPYALLTVADDGIGMNETARARAFEPFFTTKGPAQGTGLGLATVWGVVRQSGGFAAIDSTEGVGTTVSVWLPASAEATSPAVPPTVAVGPPRAASILVAEDDDAVRELLVRTLRSAGHTVIVASDPEAAEVAAAGAAGPIDLLVTDVVMPRCNGHELARRIRRTRPALRVLFVSGYADGAFDVGSLPRGSDFLAKPFTREALLARVRDVLAAAP